MSTETYKLILFGKTYVGNNVRLPNRMQLDGITADIELRGLTDPIEVWAKGEGFEVLKGHRRHAAITRMDQDAFKKHFSKGVPCTVVGGITEAEAEIRKVDHGSELPLGDPHEVQLCADKLFANGMTESQVVIILATLLDRVSPMKAKKQKEMEALTTEGERKEFYFKYRRGMVQHMHNVQRSPDCLSAALYFKASGVKPEGFEKSALPDLTNDRVTTLYKAHKEDLEDAPNGVAKYGKKSPGPLFRTKWNKLIEDQAKAKTTGKKEPNPKSMSAKDIKEGAAEFNSQGFRKLAAYHAGEKGISLAEIKEADSTLYYIELLTENDPDYLDDFLKLAQDIETRLKAEQEKAEGVVADESAA